MTQPLTSRSDSTLLMKHSPDAAMVGKLRGLIEQWRVEQRGRHERIEQFARIALGEIPAGAPPLQDPELYFWPGLESHPFHDRTVPWMGELEAAYPAIRAELTGLLDAKIAFTPYAQGADAHYRQEKFNLEEGSDRWSIYNLLDPAAESNCQKTIEHLQRWFRDELGEPMTAQFSALRAGAHIPAHCGVSNAFLTAHLGLIVPQGCSIRVGNERREWSEGRGFVFDDSFEHEVWNESDSRRIVFIARFYHPALTELEIEALGTLHERVRGLVGENTSVQRELLRRLRRSS
ncbi:MAG TPA: aspartyl/asparaginyl beta-hydroxylase domain-containing protein [Candidatus Acidoferrum sp.]|nr:aspartyl/asparaginyl beta-hydroxylase domain-containing protein [Candidatus Acidoferrum sp.]